MVQRSLNWFVWQPKLAQIRLGFSAVMVKSERYRFLTGARPCGKFHRFHILIFWLMQILVYNVADTLDFSPPFAGCIVYDISLPHFPQSKTFLCRLFPRFSSVSLSFLFPISQPVWVAFADTHSRIRG